MSLTNPTNLVDVQCLERFKENLDPILETKADKANTYTKQQVDAKISELDRRYRVEFSEHTLVFTGSPVTVTNHTLVFS